MKKHRHVWEYSENVWKRNICKKCGEFQKFDPVLNPRKKSKHRREDKRGHRRCSLDMKLTQENWQEFRDCCKRIAKKQRPVGRKG